MSLLMRSLTSTIAVAGRLALTICPRARAVSRHPHLIPDADRSRIADDRLPDGSAGDILPMDGATDPRFREGARCGPARHVAGRAEAHPLFCKDDCSDALVPVQNPQEQVFGADVVVQQPIGFSSR